MNGWRSCRIYAQWNIQFSSVDQSCLTFCDPMNCSTPGLPVHHQLPEFTQIHVHWVSDAIQPSHPLLSPSPPAPSPSQHQSFPMSQLFAWGGQSTGVSALASFLPKKSQGWSPSEWFGWISSMGYYSAIKRNKSESVLVRWMNLEPVIQSEVSQKEKNKYCILTHMYGI